MTVAVALLAALGLWLMYRGATDVRRPFDRPSRPATYLGETGWRWLSVSNFVLLTGICFVIGTLAVLALGFNAVLAVAAGAGAATLPFGRVRSRRLKNLRDRASSWPDALSVLISAARSGASLAESCMTLAEKGPVSLRPAFTGFARTYRAFGSFEIAVTRLRDDLADPIADRVTVVLSMAHQVGGCDLVRVLRATSDAIREELRIGNEVRARWSWTVTAARVAAAAPYLVVVMMSLRPEAGAAFASPGGTFVLLLGSVAILAGYRLMLRAARLPEERRLLG